MEHDHHRQPSSQLSDYSLNSNSTLIASPSSPPLYRDDHHPAISTVKEEDSGLGAGSSQRESYGLGISNTNESNPASLGRKHVANKASSGSVDLLLSSMSPYPPEQDRFDEEQDQNLHANSDLSSRQPFTANSDREPLKKHVPPTETDFECRIEKRPGNGRKSWLAVSVLVLAFYSTLFSGIWLVIAIMRVQYGPKLSRRGLNFATASTLYTAFAKSIELSFVTVFVAFIGQVLSKRALLQPRGVTISEMTMRSWVMQPGSYSSGKHLLLLTADSGSYADHKICVGTIISHWATVQNGASTKLGMLSLLVALMAMTYTTASDALIVPVLRFSKTENQLMHGKVSTSFANSQSIMNSCKTPISTNIDPDNSGPTCISLQHPAQAYHNYVQYLASWVDNISSGNGSDDMTQRPDPVGMLYDNTTLKGSWTNVQNMSLLSQQYQRSVYNVTMAMPHAGVVAAAMDPINGIIQPSDLNVCLNKSAVHQCPIF